MDDAAKELYVIYVILIYSIYVFLNSVIYVNKGKNIVLMLTYAKSALHTKNK